MKTFAVVLLAMLTLTARVGWAQYNTAEIDGVLLDMTADEPFTIVGDLKDRRRYQLDSLLARAGDRPELQTLAAEIREAQAQVVRQPSAHAAPVRAA